jgi:transcriptional regulator with XRE-family HTH domain
LQDANRTEDNLKVGKRIVKIRKAKGLTQDGLAQISVNRTHLYRVENGIQSPTVATLKKIADALEVRVKDLVKDL